MPQRLFERKDLGACRHVAVAGGRVYGLSGAGLISVTVTGSDSRRYADGEAGATCFAADGGFAGWSARDSLVLLDLGSGRQTVIKMEAPAQRLTIFDGTAVVGFSARAQLSIRAYDCGAGTLRWSVGPEVLEKLVAEGIGGLPSPRNDGSVPWLAGLGILRGHGPVEVRFSDGFHSFHVRADTGMTTLGGSGTTLAMCTDADGTDEYMATPNGLISYARARSIFEKDLAGTRLICASRERAFWVTQSADSREELIALRLKGGGRRHSIVMESQAGSITSIAAAGDDLWIAQQDTGVQQWLAR